MKYVLIMIIAFSGQVFAEENPNQTQIQNNMAEYCKKHPQAVECKPKQVKESLDKAIQMQDKKLQDQMKDLDQ